MSARENKHYPFVLRGLETLPPELALIFEGLLAKWSCAVPTWVHLIRIELGKNPESYVEVRSDSTRRRVDVWPGVGLIENERDHREIIVLHEIGHVLLAPLAKAAERVVERALSEAGADDTAVELARAAMEDAEEEAASDVALALLRARVVGQVEGRRHPGGGDVDG